MKKLMIGALALSLACIMALAPAAGFAATFDSVSHIHGVKVFGKEILMPTHEGLYRYSAANSMKILPGPIFDVMGLGVYGTTLYASGHPGEKSKFAQPIGFISSSDGAKSWKQISLKGEVDFHMLEVGKFDMYGADSGSGQLMHSGDRGKSWKKLGASKYSDIAPLDTKKGAAYALLEGSLVQTSDGFATTVAIKSKMKWSSIEAVGSTLYGASGKDIYRSIDGAKSWKKIASLPNEISSISVNTQVFAAVAGGAIFISRDAGKTFTS